MTIRRPAQWERGTNRLQAASLGSDARVAEGGALIGRYRVLNPYGELESLSPGHPVIRDPAHSPRFGEMSRVLKPPRLAAHTTAPKPTSATGADRAGHQLR